VATEPIQDQLRPSDPVVRRSRTAAPFNLS
jgi:hypothetical protein